MELCHWLAILDISWNYLGTFVTAASTMKTSLDPKRRNDLVDEAFLEQKDILLEMLEAKLKEVRDKKKRKQESPGEGFKCENGPKNVDLRLKAQGLSAVGEAEASLKFGQNGNSSVVLESSGVSNIGRAHVELDVGDGAVHIPGLNNLFSGAIIGVCDKQNKTDKDSKDKLFVAVDDDLESRRHGANVTEAKPAKSSKASKAPSKSTAASKTAPTTPFTAATEGSTVEDTSPPGE